MGQEMELYKGHIGTGEIVGEWTRFYALHELISSQIKDDWNCMWQETFIDKNVMSKIIDVVNDVLDNREKAPELMKDQFEYDDSYFKRLEYTKYVFEKAFKDTENEYYYYSYI
jgi:hypothetical protein